MKKLLNFLKDFFKRPINAFFGGVYVGILFVCILISIGSPVESFAETSTDLVYPTPAANIDYFYLIFEDEGELVPVEPIIGISSNLAISLTAPSGYSMADCKGIGVWLYSATYENVNSAFARFIFRAPALVEDGIYKGFTNVNFEYMYRRQVSDIYRSKLTYMAVNDNFQGDLENQSQIDVSFYALMRNTTLDDNETEGNIAFEVYFDFSRNAAIEVIYLGGYVNADLAQTISALTSSGSSKFSSPNLSDFTDLAEVSNFFDNLRGIMVAVDPLQGLSVSSSLIAVYNPVLDALYSTPPFNYIMVLLVAVLPFSVVFFWLRRKV